MCVDQEQSCLIQYVWKIVGYVRIGWIFKFGMKQLYIYFQSMQGPDLMISGK